MPTASASPDLASFIRSGNFAAVQDALLHLRPPEAADALAPLPAADQIAALTLLPHRVAAGVFEYLPLPTQQALSQTMAPKEAAAVLNLVADDDRTQLLSRLPEAETREILSLLTPEESFEARAAT
jgi:Mg/Co/Ni transporter MgtE